MVRAPDTVLQNASDRFSTVCSRARRMVHKLPRCSPTGHFSKSPGICPWVLKDVSPSDLRGSGLSAPQAQYLSWIALVFSLRARPLRILSILDSGSFMRSPFPSIESCSEAQSEGTGERPRATLPLRDKVCRVRALPQSIDSTVGYPGNGPRRSQGKAQHRPC